MKRDQFGKLLEHVANKLPREGGHGLKVRYQPSEGKIYAQDLDYERQAILQENAELRKLDRGRYTGWTGERLQIPQDDYKALCIKYPVIRYGTKEDRDRFWKRFLKSPESLPYRCQ